MPPPGSTRVDRYDLKYRMMFLQDKNDGIKGEIVEKTKLAMMLRDKSLHVGLGWITEPYHDVSKLSTRERVRCRPVVLEVK